ncbi:S8 family peptidase [Peristeroidobacter agariperforans]|uniref:S8 family peptidase n=1 Tax=Peristeroidobacter agariperforans TaxID=268404 RepID=UPI00101C85D2|nr:S8 family serine peptidase [Peristeroidobacter agariperforans]
MRRLTALLAILVVAGCTQLTRETTDEELIRTHPERFVVITLHNTDTTPSARAGSSPRDYGSTMPYAIAPTTRATARQLATHYRMKPVREWPIAQLSVHCIVYEMNAGESQSDLLRRLRSDARVESAQPLNSFATMGRADTGSYDNGPYNDPYARLQGSLTAMGVPQAHAWSRGKGVSIAVIDTGVDASHADLAGSHVSVSNFTGQRLRPAAHGTAVTGIIAATGGNRLGIVGVAPEADVHALAACWAAAANPSQAVCDSFTLAIALANAIELKANVVNLSLGGPSDPLLRRLVEHGLARNMIFVAALPGAGVANGFPSEIPGVVVVDAVGHEHTARDVLLAPGTDVLTLVPPNGYDFVSGSSMAAANVSGGIALLLSHRLKANEVREVLAQTAPTGDSINLCVALAGRQAHQRCQPTVSRAARSD